MGSSGDRPENAAKPIKERQRIPQSVSLFGGALVETLKPARRAMELALFLPFGEPPSYYVD
jgi:hypothetical protein